MCRELFATIDAMNNTVADNMTETIVFTKPAQAEDFVGGFSAPSKMPCRAYSIPAQECGIGRIMRGVKGSVCSKCYALKGRYVFPNVKAALYRRFSSLQSPKWVEAIAFSINKRGDTFFRWHDSGDLQGVWHLQNIVEVAKRCPNTKFWLPTREANIVSEYFENGGELPVNLTIRVSGTMIDGKKPDGLIAKFGLVASSVTTDKNKVTCFAFQNQGKCGDCRACWNKEVSEVVYLQH